MVVEFAAGLSVALPLEQAEKQLRAPASESDLQRVRSALREEQELGQAPWLSRQNGARAKLSSGDPVSLAELVSEGASRERLRAGKGSKATAPEGEKRFFADARQRLADEIAHVRGLDAAEADRWIGQQLAHTK